MDYTNQYYQQQSPFSVETEPVPRYIDEFAAYPVIEESPNGSFVVRRISKRILVCECTKDGHRIAKNWGKPVDHIRKFITYVGFGESDNNDWQFRIQQVKLMASKCKERNSQRLSTDKELKVYGLSAGTVRMLAAFDD